MAEPLKKGVVVRWKAWVERALLCAFGECLLQKVTGVTAVVNRVSRTKEEDSLSLGNVSAGEWASGQTDGGHRSHDAEATEGQSDVIRCDQQPGPF